MIVRLDRCADNAASLRDFAETYASRENGVTIDLNGVEIHTRRHHNERSYDAGMCAAQYLVYHRENFDPVGLRPSSWGYGVSGLEQALRCVETHGGWIVESYYTPVPHKEEIETLLCEASRTGDWCSFRGGEVSRVNGDGTPYGAYQVKNRNGDSIYASTLAEARGIVSRLMVEFNTSEEGKQEGEPYPYEAAIRKVLDYARGSEFWHGFDGGSVRERGCGFDVLVNGDTTFCSTYAATVAIVSDAMVDYFASARYAKDKAKREARHARLFHPDRKPHKPIGWDATDEEMRQLMDVEILHR